MNNPVIKTIDVQAKEWFDRVNGNSYFSAQVTLNFGMPDAKTIHVPFQYGYGSQFEDEAFAELERVGLITDREAYSNGAREPRHQYCKRHGIIARYSKLDKCLKRDVVAFGIA